jgi:hypothetical protein
MRDALGRAGCSNRARICGVLHCGEASREAPAQAELRPTCAGALLGRLLTLVPMLVSAMRLGMCVDDSRAVAMTVRVEQMGFIQQAFVSQNESGNSVGSKRLVKRLTLAPFDRFDRFRGNALSLAK